MKRIGLYIVCTFILLCAHQSMLVAQQIKAISSAETVYTNQPFTVVYTISGDRGYNFEAPDFKPFKQLSGPFKKSSISIVNGVRSSEVSYTYQLSMSKVGKYTISGAKLKTGSYTRRSNKLRIQVVKSGDANIDHNNELFIEMSLRDSTIYVGQQVLLDHQVFSGNKKIKGSSIVGQFPKDRFMINIVKDGTSMMNTQVMRDNKLYNKAFISRLAIYPLRSGKIQIPDINFEVDVDDPRTTRRSIFGFNTYQRKALRTAGFELDVKPLPSNPPASFTGCVGRLNVQSQMSEGPYSIGDEIMLNLEMEGTGISEQVNPPNWKQAGLDILEPKLVKDRKSIHNGEIIFQKIYQYVVIPKKAGQLRLKIPYAFFDPKTEQFVEKESNSTLINIAAGSTGLSDASQKNLTEQAKQESKLWYQKKWIWGLALAGLAGLLFFLFKPKKEIQNTPKLSQEEAALIKAKRSLSEAESILQSGNKDRYWETLEHALRIYLEEKLEIGTSKYSISEITTRWEQKNYPQTHIDTWRDMVDKINRARYAGQSIQNMEQLYQQGLDWIVQVEKDTTT